MDKKKPMSKPWENNEPFIKFVKEYVDEVVGPAEPITLPSLAGDGPI